MKKLGLLIRTILFAGFILSFIFTFAFSYTFAFSFSADDSQSIFTPEERDWLDAHPVLYVAPDPNYAPVEFYKDDTFQGLSIDYLNWISDTYDITFEFKYYASWAEIMTALKSGDIQLQSAIIKTPERDKYLSFTDPYSDMPSVLMIRKDFKEILNDKTLFDYKVGVIDDFAVEEYIREKYQPDQLVELSNVKVALEALSVSKVDVLVLDIGQATYYVEEMGLTNVMITNSIQLDFPIKLSFAANSDNAILTSIMDKALKSIPTEIQQASANKWLGIGEFTTFDTKLFMTFITILGTITVLFLFVSIWLLTIRKKDKELAAVNQKLQEQIIALNEAQHQLVESEKINALSRLAIGVSHEINTPIGNGISITSFIQSLIQEMQRKISTQDEKSVDILNQMSESNLLALQSLEKVAKIISDFQSVANYQLHTEEKEIDLSEALEQMATILASHDTMRSKIHLDIQPEIRTVLSSQILLQILSALMENSFFHAYGQSTGQIDIALKSVEDMIYIHYRDYGTGIPSQALPNIFEPFYSTKRGSKERLGLGLFSVYNIITQVLNGQIEVISEPDAGTTFQIKFPLKKAIMKTL